MHSPTRRPSAGCWGSPGTVTVLCPGRTWCGAFHQFGTQHIDCLLGWIQCEGPATFVPSCFLLSQVPLKVYTHMAHEKQQKSAGMANCPCLPGSEPFLGMQEFSMLSQDSLGNRGGGSPYSYSNLPSVGLRLKWCLL